LSAEKLLSRLNKVRKTGPNRWIACCPAHEDRNPSLNVKEEADGTLLVICRSGCDNNAIREAAGLEWRDFFPERSTGIYDRKLERAFPAAEVLRALADEATLVAVAACNVANGIELTAEDKSRVLVAAGRIQAAKDMALGTR
jgi:hypothetical protein